MTLYDERAVPTIKWRLVDASTLSDYENFGILSGLASSAFFGFLVAWVQEDELRAARALLAITVLCAFAFIAVFGLAIAKRSKLQTESRTMTYKRSAPPKHLDNVDTVTTVTTTTPGPANTKE